MKNACIKTYASSRKDDDKRNSRKDIMIECVVPEKSSSYQIAAQFSAQGIVDPEASFIEMFRDECVKARRRLRSSRIASRNRHRQAALHLHLNGHVAANPENGGRDGAEREDDNEGGG